MGALSDRMLADGCARHIEAVHGEIVTMLDGVDAGRAFNAVREVESDQILTTELGLDPRAKIVLRFLEATTPRIAGQGAKLQTEDGRKWYAVRRQEAGFLTNDFELTEITVQDS